MMEILKKNYKVLIGITIGIMISSIGVHAVTTIVGSNITYSNIKSGLSSTNVQEAIDELYEKSDIRKSGKFVAAYTYSEIGENKCITGEESTCKRTTCYKTKTANSCPSGTIIKYRVNNTDIVGFNVLFDEGNTITMQSQVNTIYDTSWDSGDDNTKGPLISLSTLESTTKGWNNVNNQTYTLGVTSLSGKGAYTECDRNLNCIENAYTLPGRTAKARLVTVQELKVLGCKTGASSCPKYLSNDYYWTSSASSTYPDDAWSVCSNGSICTTIIGDPVGIRSVVVVSK